MQTNNVLKNCVAVSTSVVQSRSVSDNEQQRVDSNQVVNDENRIFTFISVTYTIDVINALFLERLLF